MQIEVYSDVVCPWCYIGRARLQESLRQLGDRVPVAVVWRAFELNPDMPKEGRLRAAHLAEKYGGLERVREMEKNISHAARSAGLEINFDRVIRTPNTRDAHRLIHFAQKEGRGDAAVRLLFEAYFRDGKNIGLTDTLVGAGTEAGLAEAEIRRMLASDEGRRDVEDDEHKAGLLGIRGVPFVILNQQYAISGAQSPDVFLQALNEAAKTEQPV